MKKHGTSQSRRFNPVAKYATKFNKAAVHTDKKARSKAGYSKHKLSEDDIEQYRSWGYTEDEIRDLSDPD